MKVQKSRKFDHSLNDTYYFKKKLRNPNNKLKLKKKKKNHVKIFNALSK